MLLKVCLGSDIMIRRTDRIDLLKSKLDSFRDYNINDFKIKSLYEEAMDNIECEINTQKEKFI